MFNFVLGFLPPWLHIIVAVVGSGALGLLAMFFPAYRVLIKIAAVVLAVGFIYFSGHHAGYNQAEKIGKENVVKQAADDKAVYDALVTSYDNATKAANSLAEKKTEALQTTINTISSNYNRVLKESNDKTKLLRDAAKTKSSAGKDSNGRDVINVTGGLSINADSCTGSNTSNGIQAASDTTVTGGATGKAEARLNGKTADDLISIVADGDAAIIQMNSVIDAYNKVQESGCTLTSAKPPTKP